MLCPVSHKKHFSAISDSGAPQALAKDKYEEAANAFAMAGEADRSKAAQKASTEIKMEKEAVKK